MEAETSEEIIAATKRALCEYGYADLTIQRIADEASMTTAAIHYHFDTKQDLLNAFLEELIDRFEERLHCEAGDPRQRLGVFLDSIFVPAEENSNDFPIALMELKAQAPYQDTYREHLLELDERMRTVVTSAVQDGIDEGYFEETDPEILARLVVTTINGGHARGVALGEDPIKTRRVIEDYLEARLGWTPEGAE